VRPLIARAVERGSLSARGAEAVGRACDRIAELAGPPEPPARLHGDLWSGNVMAGADGGAWLIDPVAYGGHREVDLAMLRLFGAPSERIFAAYAEAAPLADGHEERVGLWQLFPLMVHAVLFGGGYGGSAEDAARRYVG
jgi:fructosamine-3-kinase